jgi:hypothetical protein
MLTANRLRFKLFQAAYCFGNAPFFVCLVQLM